MKSWSLERIGEDGDKDSDFIIALSFGSMGYKYDLIYWEAIIIVGEIIYYA